MLRSKPLVALAALLAFMVSSIGMTAVAQHGDGHAHGAMGSPEASPMAGHGSTSTGAFYLTITNDGDESDRLIAVESDAAEAVEIHNVEMDGNVMHMMHEEDGVEIPAGETLVLDPGGYHVMLVGLTESLLAGEEFTATLVFEHAGEVEITVPILRTEPKDDELTAEPVEAGDLVIEGIWARQAPKLDGGMGTPVASPMAGH
jgi:copper(I)-binding protein